MENKSIFNESLKKAMGGGLSGATAMTTQVLSLMWLRTTMNYQYRYGTSTTHALKTLYNQGGISRFYKGLTPALFQGPLSRFGDTAANVGVLHYLNSSDHTKNLPISVKTAFSSLTAAIWRIAIMPIDTTKTMLQVEGKNGFTNLVSKCSKNGPSVLFHGSLAASSATFVGHFPWFFTYNYLDTKLPQYDTTLNNLVRNGAIGFSSSVVSDTCSNSLRVIKTYKQSSIDKISYIDATKNIVQTDGLSGLFGRGLQTRILANGLQGIVFSISWKFFQKKFFS